MNKNKIIYLPAIVLLFMFGACRDMLDTNSSLIAMEDEYKIANATEAVAALEGILYELTSVADRYVLMGELRGDLMTTSGFASTALQDVERFQAAKDNEYADKRAYYNVINNCNFLLQKLDTSLVIQNEKALLPCYVATKRLRAWTYFQMGQVYGKATWFTQPVLDLDASLASYPEMNLDALADALIDDLRPCVALYANIWSSAVIPIRILLGDLYLYKNDYRTAAGFYYDEIYDSQILVRDNANRWTNANMESLASVGHIDTYTTEDITRIPGYTALRNEHSRLVSLSYSDKPAVLPAANYVRQMAEALYLHGTGSGVIATPSGDLRGNIRGMVGILEIGDAYRYESIKGDPVCLIYKYYLGSSVLSGMDPDNALLTGGLHVQTAIPVYRIPHLYLRFAEALNRMGKPTLAFAVLKYGLTDAHVRDTLTVKVNPDELGEAFTRFPQNTFFDNNVAMTGRGRGNGVMADTTYFVIPALPAKQDSILWVEDRILDEMAAETAFEGNRFFDLLRISRRRANHPEYMAEKVAAKYADREAMKAKLMNPDNWFLP